MENNGEAIVQDSILLHAFIFLKLNCPQDTLWRVGVKIGNDQYFEISKLRI